MSGIVAGKAEPRQILTVVRAALAPELPVVQNSTGAQTAAWPLARLAVEFQVEALHQSRISLAR